MTLNQNNANKPQKVYGEKTKKERKMEIICGSIIMTLMVILIGILIGGSIAENSIEKWIWICTIIFGTLIIITLIIYIILKILFKKQRNIKDTTTKLPTGENK